MRWRLAAAASFGIGALVVIVLSALPITLHFPRTYDEAVMQVLDARGIVYGEVRVHDFCPSSPHCLGTGTVFIPMTAEVTVSGTHPADGQLTCTQRWKGAIRNDCIVSFPAYGMHNVPLPPLANEISWLMWLERHWQEVQAWWS